MGYVIVTTDGTLIHHGVKGMKWGVRRYRNKDGTLTEEGKRRYGEDGKVFLDKYDQSKKAIREAKKSGRYSYDTHYANKLEIQKRLAKSDLKNQEIRQKLRNGNIKQTKRMTKLAEKYISEGMSKEEAQIKAYRRARTEKLIAVGAGLTAAAAIGLVGYKLYKDRVDTIIPKGTKLGRVDQDNSFGTNDTFFAYLAKHKGDAKNYQDHYAQAQYKGGARDVFLKDIVVSNDIKRASPNSAYKTLKEMMKDGSPVQNLSRKKELENDLIKLRASQNLFNSTKKQRKEVNKAITALQKGKVDRHVYNAVNYAQDNAGKAFMNSYKNALRKKGYGAYGDLNDKRFSGYHSKDPIIFLNNTDTKVTNVNRIAQDAAKFKKRNDVMQLKELGESLAKGSVIGGATAGLVKAYSIHEKSRVIRQYRKDHPGTKLSDNDILRNYYKIG